MFVVQDRVAGLRALVFLLGHVFNILLGRRVWDIMVVITIRVYDRMMSTGLIVLKLVLLILLKCRVEVLLLIRPDGLLALPCTI